MAPWNRPESRRPGKGGAYHTKLVREKGDTPYTREHQEYRRGYLAENIVRCLEAPGGIACCRRCRAGACCRGGSER